MGSKGGSTDIERVSRLTRGQSDLLDQLTTLVGGQLGKGLTPLYTGQRVASTSPLQQAAFGAFGGLAPTPAAAMTVFGQGLGRFDPSFASGVLGQGREALTSTLADFDPASAQQYWETAFKAPAMQTFREDIVPAIAERFAGQGAVRSGAFGRTLAREGGRFATGLNAQLAQILFQAEQGQRARQQAGIGQAIGLAQTPVDILGGLGRIGGMGADLASQLLNIGGAQRGIEQQQLTDAFSQWMEAQPQANPWLQYLAPALQTSAFMAEPVVTATEGWGSALMPALGAFGGQALGGLFGGGAAAGGAAAGGAAAGGGLGSAIAALGPLLFSDKRLKKNIKYLTIDFPVNVALWDWNGKANALGLIGSDIGFIAQDVEKYYPKLVVTMKDGYKAIFKTLLANSLLRT